MTQLLALGHRLQPACRRDCAHKPPLLQVAVNTSLGQGRCRNLGGGRPRKGASAARPRLPALTGGELDASCRHMGQPRPRKGVTEAQTTTSAPRARCLSPIFAACASRGDTDPSYSGKRRPRGAGSEATRADAPTCSADLVPRYAAHARHGRPNAHPGAIQRLCGCVLACPPCRLRPGTGTGLPFTAPWRARAGPCLVSVTVASGSQVTRALPMAAFASEAQASLAGASRAVRVALRCGALLPSARSPSPSPAPCGLAPDTLPLPGPLAVPRCATPRPAVP